MQRDPDLSECFGLPLRGRGEFAGTGTLLRPQRVGERESQLREEDARLGGALGDGIDQRPLQQPRGLLSIAVFAREFGQCEPGPGGVVHVRGPRLLVVERHGAPQVQAHERPVAQTIVAARDLSLHVAGAAVILGAPHQDFDRTLQPRYRLSVLVLARVGQRDVDHRDDATWVFRIGPLEDLHRALVHLTRARLIAGPREHDAQVAHDRGPIELDAPWVFLEDFDRKLEVGRGRPVSLALDLDETHIEKVFGVNPSPYLKLIRYPKTPSGGQGVGVHKDSGFLTLLLQDENPGLEAQANNGRWCRVDPVPGSLVVNTGELLQLITRNYFIATPHRVVNHGDNVRYSSALFYSPDLSTVLNPLPLDPEYLAQVNNSERHRGEGLMASRAEMSGGTGGMGSQFRPAVFGEKYWQRWVRSYPDIARKFYPGLMDR